MALSGPRLQLAAKAGLAAGLAFLIAPLMPGAAAQYPYYAPLGALVAMYENVSGSMKQGVQTLVGLGLGIGLAFLLISVSEPSPVTVAIVMALGVLLAGLPRLGAGRDWIPTAALLVLLVGGQQPGRLLLRLPPSDGRGSRRRYRRQHAGFPAPAFQGCGAEPRRAPAGRSPSSCRTWARRCREKWPPEHEDWAVRSEELAQSARAVRAAVQKADASREANPRRRFHPHDVDRDYQNVRDLESVTFHIQDMTEVLADVIWDKDMPFIIPLPYSEPLADALAAVSEVLRSMEDEHPERQDELLECGQGCRGRPGRADGIRRRQPDAPSAAESILLSLHRILRVVGLTAGQPALSYQLGTTAPPLIR